MKVTSLNIGVLKLEQIALFLEQPLKGKPLTPGRVRVMVELKNGMYLIYREHVNERKSTRVSSQELPPPTDLGEGERDLPFSPIGRRGWGMRAYIGEMLPMFISPLMPLIIGLETAVDSCPIED